MIPLLIRKDWHIYQKQLAGFLAGILLALSLIGTGTRWSFNAGGLLLLVLLISTGFYAINSIIANERKESTLPFIMSLPASPLDLFLAKLCAGLLLYLVPFGTTLATTTFLILATPLPDGLLVYVWLILCFMLCSYCLALCFAILVESEAWNIFLQIALMTLLSPFMIWTGSLPPIATTIRTNQILWAAQPLSILAAELTLTLATLGLTCWLRWRQTNAPAITD